MGDSTAPTGKSKRLSDVVREVKIATAEREDVVVDMKEADKARLELLARCTTSSEQRASSSEPISRHQMIQANLISL